MCGARGDLEHEGGPRQWGGLLAEADMKQIGTAFADGIINLDNTGQERESM